jgi:hypothetical protein
MTQNCIIGDSIIENVTIGRTNDIGEGLFSKISHKSGDVVFEEIPLQIRPETLSIPEEELLRRISEQSSYDLTDDFVYLKSFCSSATNVRSSVLSLYSPPEAAISSSNLLSSLCRLADVCTIYDWAKPYTKEVLRKAILVKACNAHGFNFHSSLAAALYSYGSKINHSCKPNVVYTSQRNSTGCGSFIARTNIRPGDQLFISYIDTFRTTPMRQKQLMENYAFQCSCDLCTKEVDKFRGLNCPACDSGPTYRNNSTSTWTCSNCTQTLTDSTKGISDSDESALVDSSSLFLNSFESRISQRLEDHITFLITRLGRYHAATKIAQKHFIEYVLLDRKNCDELVAVTNEILEWTDNDPTFLDSILIQIGCHVARTGGDFSQASRYLEIVKADLLFLTGQESDLEQLDIVNRALKACENRDQQSVPDLVSPNEGCNIQ